MSAFLLFYYTDYVHVSAATIMLLSRVLDGVTDLIMGVIVDRTKSRFGKCRPWILRMAIPFALAGILLFSVPSGLGETSKLVYIFITYNLVSSVVYTAINVTECTDYTEPVRAFCPQHLPYDPGNYRHTAHHQSDPAAGTVLRR